jgi:hypothetical protein
MKGSVAVSLAAVFALLDVGVSFPSTVVVSSTKRHSVQSSTLVLEALSKRELEIRRKIKQLKQEGRIQKDELEDDDDDDDVYASKIRQKLGNAKSRMLGFDSNTNDDAVGSPVEEKSFVEDTALRRKVQIGALSPELDASNMDPASGYQRLKGGSDASANSDEEDDDFRDDEKEEFPEDDLVELVARRMKEKRERESQEQQSRLKQEARETLARIESERTASAAKQPVSAEGSTSSTSTMEPAKQLTTGIGGSWDRGGGATSDAEQDVYQPKTGSWGAFPRPRDISKAYGGGRRVGPGYTNEETAISSVEETRRRLQEYRVKMGIDVASEKEHADEIDEALKMASYAMQRGVYSSAVTILEKVTKYCSSNSKVGGKVFLELAMAYEAVGRSKEAIAVYTTLSRSRIEEIKVNAKRLLYGIEAIKFMQENVGSDEFSRKQAKMTFIDTTGLGDIASKFDDVYETAYVDLNRGFYKQLTEAVVRTSREARQILLRATGPGEVSRLRVVQALRSLSRHFDDALQAEIEKSKPVAEPVAVMDGKPILSVKDDDDDDISALASLDDFVLMDPKQMMENLQGEWRLQLIADKRGDGVKFFNNTLSWQRLDTNTMSFSSLCPQGFLSVEQTGDITFNTKRRILRRESVEVSGGGTLLVGLLGTKLGAVGAVRNEQQVVTVDMAMMVTRGVPNKRVRSKEEEKDYFAVWRRVESGTYSEKIQ